MAGDDKKSQASWAMRWVMDLPNVQVVLSGMSDENQVMDNIVTFSEAQPLTEEEQERIKRAAKIQHSSVVVACTGCGVCARHCPQGFHIPQILKELNKMIEEI